VKVACHPLDRDGAATRYRHIKSAVIHDGNLLCHQ
jgi:hypothetical protein